MGQQVLDIEDATDIVSRILIDGNTRVVVLHDALDDFGEGRPEVEVHDVLAAGHHLLGGLVAKADDALQHVLLFLQFLFVRQFQCLLQVVDAQDAALLLHHLLCQCSRPYQDACQRIEHLPEHHDGGCKHAADGQGMLTAVNLRHDLTKEQEQKRQQNGDDDELQPLGISEVYPTAEEVVAEHDDGDVDHVVTDEDRGESPFGVSAQETDFPVGFVFFLVQLIQVVGREREESNL